MLIDYKNNKNKLIYGDNLTVMQEMPGNFVDLIYLDPPFNSNRSYNMMYKTMTGHPVPEQVEAFCDTWTLSSEDIEKLRLIRPTLEHYGLDDSIINFWDNWMKALQNTNDKLLSYLFYMMERLFEMRRILKPTGSIYLHCDPTASHYIKVMMDGVFGHKNFRNEIVWLRDAEGKGAKNISTQWPRTHDIIFMYSKNDKIIFKQQYTNISEYQAQYYQYIEKETGRKFRHTPLGDYSQDSIRKMEQEGLIYTTKSGKKYKKYYLDEAKSVIGDIWSNIKGYGVRSASRERLGYPTQKPIALLERIIKASCPEDGIIFDPFCGCGTSIYAAQKLDRKWIGCDIAILSTRLVKETLEAGKKPLMNHPLKEGIDFDLCGYPTSVEGAKLLFEQDPKQFEHWAVEWVGGFINKKQSGDKGIDGRIYYEKHGKELGKMILSVKGGKHITPSMVRDLRGVMEREEAEFAGLILTTPATKGMIDEASKAGQYEFNGIKYDRIQILTTKEMTEDKKIFNLPNRIGHKHKDNQLEMYL